MNKRAFIRQHKAGGVPARPNKTRYLTDPWILENIPFSLGKGQKVLEIGFGMGCDFTMYRTFSAFHLFSKILAEGILGGKLKSIGYQGLMATIEKGADGKKIRPLVKTYRKTQLKHMLADFSDVKFSCAHFKREQMSNLKILIPPFAEKYLEKWLGWYLIAYATKFDS